MHRGQMLGDLPTLGKSKSSVSGDGEPTQSWLTPHSKDDDV